jgi:hypothetical protein
MNILIIVDRFEIPSALETNVATIVKSISRKKFNNKITIYSNAISKKYRTELSAHGLIADWNEENEKYILEEIKPDVIIANQFSSINIGHKLANKIEGCKFFAIMYQNNTIGLTEDNIKKLNGVFCVNELAYKVSKELIPESKLHKIYTAINEKDFYPTQTHNATYNKLKLTASFKTMVLIPEYQNNKQKMVEQILSISENIGNSLMGLNVIICNYFVNKEIEEIIKNKRKSPNLKIASVEKLVNLRSLINLSDIVIASNREAIKAIFCKKNILCYDTDWKGLITYDNYKNLLFGESKTIEFNDDTLTAELIKLINSKENDMKLYNEIVASCNSKYVGDKYIEIIS